MPDLIGHPSIVMPDLIGHPSIVMPDLIGHPDFNVISERLPHNKGGYIWTPTFVGVTLTTDCY